MSLADRVAQIRNARSEKERQALLEAGRRNEARIAEQLAAIELKKQQEAVRKAELIEELTPLLELVGARQRLEEVESMAGWQNGVIDSQPKYAGGRLDLGITYKYHDLEETYSTVWNGDNGNSEHTGSSIHSMNARLVIMVGHLGAPNTIMVGTHYGQSQNIHEEPEPPVIWVNNKCLANIERIPQDNPDRAKQILEDQMVEIIANERGWYNWKSPDYLASEGKVKIMKDRFIPEKVKHQYFPDVRAALPWYKRILG